MLGRFPDENGGGIDAEYVHTENGNKRPSFQWRWYHVLLIPLVIFPYISIGVLFDLVGSYKKTTNQNYVSVIFAF